MIVNSFMEEFGELKLKDKRITSRFINVLERFYESPGKTINKMCESWKESKATYRLFSNPHLSLEKILETHRGQVEYRIRESNDDYVLAIQDTTTVNFTNRPSIEGLSSTAMGAMGGKANGLFVHASLLFSESEQFFGILDSFIYTRGHEKNEGNEHTRWFKGVESAGELAKKVGKKIVCVCDREADKFKIYDDCERLGLNYVIRSKNKISRQEPNHGYQMFGKYDLKTYVTSTFEKLGSYDLKLDTRKRNKKGETIVHQKVAERVARVNLYSGHLIQSGLKVGVVAAIEEGSSLKKEDQICWLLKTNIEAETFEKALRIINIYRKRWHVETYFKTLKSVCGIKNCCLREFSRIENYLTSMLLVGWRIYAIKCAEKYMPNETCEKILDPLEWKMIVARLTTKDKIKEQIKKGPPTIKEAVKMLAMIGGYNGRKGDGPPGILSMASGLYKVEHMVYGSEITMIVQNCG